MQVVGMTSKAIISTDITPKAVGTYSQAIKTGILLFVSGQIHINNHGQVIGDDIAT